MAGEVLGYGVEEQEVEAIYDSLVGDREGEDLLHRYMYLSSRQSLFAAVATRLAGERADLAAELYQEMGEGRSYAKVADALGTSRSRVQQWIERGRAD